MLYRVRNLSLFLVLLLGIFSMWAATINVPADYTTIQAAINAATAGDEIQVGPGTYTGNVVITKSLTLISTDGAATTILDGLASDPGLGTIHINTGVNNLTIGTTNHGFHVKGIDGPAGLEKAAIYFQGAQNNVLVQGNIIEARGDAGMMGESGGANTNFTIDNNIITGQTFLGDNPAGVGFNAQFNLLNVPRQLVVFGAGAGTVNTQNFTFTNNVLSGIAGGMSITNDSGAPIAPTPQGNTLMSLEIAGTCIVSNNTFSGITTRYAEALRMRASGAYTFSGNVFNGTYPVIATAATTTPAIGIARISDLLATSTFTKYAVVRSGGALAVATIFPTINGAIASAVAGQEVYVSPGTFNESILVNKAITVNGANGAILDGTGLNVVAGVLIKSGNVTFNNIAVVNFSKNGIIVGYEASTPGNLHNVAITNCKIDNIQPGASGFGLYVGYESEGFSNGKLTTHLDYSGLVIEGNEISNTNDAALCLQSITSTSGTPLLVTNNYIHDGDASGIWIDAARNILIDDNIVDGNSWGFFFTGGHAEGWYYTQNGTYGPKDITITNNQIINNSGFGVGFYSGWTSTIHINDNVIDGSPQNSGVRNSLSLTLDASNNWWGDTDPSNDVNGNVNYDPWYTSQTMSDLDSNAPIENVTQNEFFTTIQAAVNAATPEDVIVIEGGTYTENLLLNKKVTLQPANREPIILDGGGAGSVITITADGVEVTGMTIQNSGSGQTDAGVLINQASDCNIHGNTITGNGNGTLTILGGLNTISNNTVTANDYYGIAFVGASGNTIELNNISGNGLDAIAMINAEDLGAPTVVSSANHIKTNTITSNRDGVFIGEGCAGNFVTDNNTITAASIGVSVWRPSNQVITGNTISSSATGIRLLGSSNNVITGNNITANQIGMLVDASWQAGTWYPSLNNDIQNNRFIGNTMYAIDAIDTEYGQQPSIVAERNYWGSPSGPATGATGNRVANVDYDPWWINYPMTILSTDVTLSLSTPEHLVKDLETQPFAVTLAQVEDLRGFNVQIKVPKVDYAIPANIAIGPSFAVGENTLFTFDSSDNDYWMIDVTGSYDGAASLDGPNLVLFTFDLTTLENASNLTGSQIELPLAQVLMYDEMNQYIPCAGTTGEIVIIDSGEPTMMQQPENAIAYPSGMLLHVDPAAPTTLIRPTLNYTYYDDYNLDYSKYLIYPLGGIVPATIADFATGTDMDPIDNADTAVAWQLPEIINTYGDGTYVVYFLIVDDAGNLNVNTWSFVIDKSAPDTPLWTSCLTTIDGANSVDLIWTGDAAKYDIWVLNYDDLTDAGGYPLYNPAAFGTPAIPAAPVAYNPLPQNGWTRIENDLVGTTYTHAPAVRGYYYYYIFAEDLAGNYSPVSELRESISYWPGDVNETPDGLVNSDDIVLLGSVWGQTAGISTFDVGPSIGRLRRGRPTPDGRINIEDLMMFSMNYMNTNYTAYPRSTNDSKPDPVRIDIEQEILGNELIVRLILSENNGLVKGLNIPLEIGSGLELQSVTAGTIWGEESVLLHTNEQGKVELSGSNLTDCIADNGLVATLSFKISGQNTELALKHMIARAFDNSDIEIIDNPQDAPSGDDDPEIIIPATSFLGANYPNPFNPTTTIGFGLNESGNVKISVFNSRGQLVRTLVNGSMQAGMHNVVWNGMDDTNRPLGSGIYFIKMQTRNLEQTTRAIMVK